MRHAARYNGCLVLTLAALVVVGVESEAGAQSASLFLRDLPTRGPMPLTLGNSSWTFRPLPPPREVRVYDIVSVRVDMRSTTLAEGEMERRKNSSYDAVLKEWIMLEGIKRVRPAPQSLGDPRVQGTLNQLFRAQSELETRESLKFDIAAMVYSIRPNGNLVLEAHSEFNTTENDWLYSLRGTCRRQDIGPDNVILSKDIYGLNVKKRESGHVSDGYRRGWFLKWFDTFDPF